MSPPPETAPALVGSYCGQNQQQQIQVPARIAYKSYQYSPEEGPWVMLPYGQIFGFNSQADAQTQAWVPPPIKQTDIWSAQQTFPL
jgi:hypothetical protein